MKNLLLLITLFVGLNLQAQSFNIDVARDSILSMNKVQEAGGNWQIKITRYIGVSDTLNNFKSYSLYVHQEKNETLIDSVKNVLSVQVADQKAAYLIQYNTAKAKRDRSIQEMNALIKLHQRLIRNETKINAL